MVLGESVALGSSTTTYFGLGRADLFLMDTNCALENGDGRCLSGGRDRCFGRDDSDQDCSAGECHAEEGKERVTQQVSMARKILLRAPLHPLFRAEPRKGSYGIITPFFLNFNQMNR